MRGAPLPVRRRPNARRGAGGGRGERDLPAGRAGGATSSDRASREERDATELSRVASALDVSAERAPRREFLARLRADIDRERHERAAAHRSRPSFRWAAPAALAGALAVVVALTFPAVRGTALDRGILVASGSGFVAYDPATLQERARVSVGA